jgi:hypothetical protein
MFHCLLKNKILAASRKFVENASVLRHSKPDLKICIPEATQKLARSDPKATPECPQSVPLFVEKFPDASRKFVEKALVFRESKPEVNKCFLEATQK